LKDSELRGAVLNALYEVRHSKEWPAVPDDIPPLPAVDHNTLRNIFKQLSEQGLIDFKAHSGTPAFGRARIKSFGVDVIEGNTAPPIAISIDNSVSVHGSQNVQIGGQANVQNIKMDVEKMITLVDSSDASVHEKAEAKSLLKQISENPLVQMILKHWWKIDGQD